MNFFALYQGERGVPGVPGDAGEKGEPGIGITGPPVSTCSRILTSQTLRLSSFKGIVHTKQKILSFTHCHVVSNFLLWNIKAEISVCSSHNNMVQHQKSWNIVYKSNEQLLWYCLSELELGNGFVLFHWVIQVCNDNDFSHRNTQSALSFLHPTYFPQTTIKFTLYIRFPSSFRL